MINKERKRGVVVAIKGIDISKHQGDISATAFENIVQHTNIEFIILRIGFTGYSNYKPALDPKFETFYQRARKAGIPVGVYYYSLATNESQAKEEAEFVLKHLANKVVDYPIYIDVEDSQHRQYKCSKSALASVCDKWCDIIADSGYIAGVYASKSWFVSKIGEIKAKHTKWVAQYNSKCTYQGDYDMWQYTSSGKVEGINTRVDMNYCYKTFTKPTKNAEPKVPERKYTGKLPKLPTRGYLMRKDTGTQVKYLQQFLNWYGNYKLEIDGSFGKATQNAVKQWQKSQRLKVDGCFGKASLAKAKKYIK